MERETITNPIQERLLKELEPLKIRYPNARIVDQTGYSKSVVSKYLNGKDVPSPEFIQKVSETFGINAEYVLEGKLPDSQELPVKHLLNKKQIDVNDSRGNYSDKNHPLITHKSPNDLKGLSKFDAPQERIALIDENTKKINLEYFEKYLPTEDDSNHWVPYLTSLDEVCVNAKDKSVNMVNGHPRFPITAHPDDFMRIPNTQADFIFPVESNNMEPVILKGSRISVKFVDKDEILFGKNYLVLFHDGRHDVYKIMPEVKKGIYTDRWILHSELPGYPDNFRTPDKILCIFQVKTCAKSL